MPGRWQNDKMGTAYLDVHGYRTETAMQAIEQELLDARANGYESIVIIHGAKNVRTSDMAYEGKRGFIKWELNKRLEEGRYDKSVVRIDQIDGDEMALTGRRSNHDLVALLLNAIHIPGYSAHQYTWIRLKAPIIKRKIPEWTPLPPPDFS